MRYRPTLLAPTLAACAVLTLAAAPSRAGVLPDERADVEWRTYDGGGLKVQGPAVLVRKNFKDKISVNAGYAVDQVTGASIDMVVIGASPLHEERKQKSLGVDYLDGKTTYGVAVEDSKENDYDSSTASVRIAQDMFGDLTTVTLSASRGWDKITKMGAGGQRDPNFALRKLARKTWDVGLSQVLSRNLIAGLDYEAITEQGYLQNPYRKYRFLFGNGYSLADEVYPGTRTSNAGALKLKYFLPWWHAAVTAKYRVFSDTWGIHAKTAEIGYTQPFRKDALVADLSYRHYTQNSASFYSDLFQVQNQQNYMARDRELAAQTNNTFGVALSYDFLRHKRWHLAKATGSLRWDYISYRYQNFRDATLDRNAPGTAPLYRFDATVIQAGLSVWF